VTAADLTLLVGLIVAVFVLLGVDLHFFGRGREASFREALICRSAGSSCRCWRSSPCSS
jgi:hypothetical protein